MNKKPSDNSVALLSVDKLEKYIKNTPLATVPINQFKKASRKSICKELKITYSTIGSNAKLAALFEGLDITLGLRPNDLEGMQIKDVMHLQATISQLENYIATLTAENKSLRAELNRHSHFVSYGRMAR